MRKTYKVTIQEYWPIGKLEIYFTNKLKAYNWIKRSYPNKKIMSYSYTIKEMAINNRIQIENIIIEEIKII